MSDQWEFYPCQMGEHIAFVFVNVSIGERLAEIGRTGQVLARVQLKQPREDGLTRREEFDSLSALEDGFNNYCTTAAAEMVGRITVAGFRDFAIYAEDAETVANGLRTIARDEHGYETELVVREDPEFEVYWQHLFPSPMDWQLIRNGQLLEQLETLGDSGDSPRPIDHWLHFESAADRDRCAEALESKGFSITARLEPNEERPHHGLQACREDTAEFAAINELTVMLFQLAAELGGEYDGWESPVVEDKE